MGVECLFKVEKGRRSSHQILPLFIPPLRPTAKVWKVDRASADCRNLQRPNFEFHCGSIERKSVYRRRVNTASVLIGLIPRSFS